jgi:Ca2+-binding RTX toxin-like protein
MAFSSISQKTTFSPVFTFQQKAEILQAMKTAYDGSKTAKKMFDDWINVGNEIEIKKLTGKFQVPDVNIGILTIDLDYIKNATYIDLNGTAVKDTLVTALVHEFGHALTGREDNHAASEFSVKTKDYRGDNINFVNQIYKELDLPEQVSYITYDSIGTINKFNYKYTNGAPIDAAVSLETKSANNAKTWSTISLGVSKDLLIGGPSANILKSGAGDDFLFGNGGNDILDGGNGKDTAVYFGLKGDYDIKQNIDGSWSVRNVRGAKNAGSDTLRNIEFVQFDGDTANTKKTYELAKGELTFQKDLALVIDTTGSMAYSIDFLKQQLSLLADALFISGKDTRIGIVGFKDTTIGQPSQVILPFTDQDDFADRKSAAIDAMDGLSYYVGFGYGSNEIPVALPPQPTAPNGFTVSGGGDSAETPFDRLRLALNGSMGEWRAGAGTRQIVLFTDASVKDASLASAVTALAHNIGATIGSSSSLSLTGGSIDTFKLSFSSGGSSVASRDTEGSETDPSFPSVPSNDPIDLDPIDPDPTTVQVQIFTIYIGSSGFGTTALAEIATANGGTFQNAPTNNELVQKLLEFISDTSVINGTPNADNLVGADGNESIYGLTGNDTIDGGAGNDIIYGGADVDLLFGGAGDDIFAYNSPTEGIDKINDFVVGEDRLSISRSGFGGDAVFGRDSLVGSLLDEARFTLGTSATTASQRLIYNDRSGGLFFDADGVGGKAQVRLAQLVGNPALTNNSFSVF